MWVRLQLDFGWWDLAFGVTRLVIPHHRDALKDAIEKRWSPSGNAIAILSVRSGLDLLLDTLQWPTGSEIVYSALNIPDMTMVARHHGLLPVPADLDLHRLAPNLDLLQRAITPKTKAILVAHLYGNLVPLDPIINIARRHGLMVIEDCAENYDGVYTGHPDADVSLFSFGPLKTATAFAGAVLRARDADLCARLKARHETWPCQSRADYCKRMFKYGLMKLAGSPWIYGSVRRLGKLLVGDMDRMIHHTAKSFREDEIINRLRQQPSGSLLAALARRLASFDHARIAKRTANGKLLAGLLCGHVVCPGADVEPHNYWLFPALVTDPAKTIQALESAGFDAPQVHSMRAIAAPPDRSELEAVNTTEALAHMILLPCYPAMPESELCRMAQVLIRVESETSLVSALKVTRQPADTLVGENARVATTPDACTDAVSVEN